MCALIASLKRFAHWLKAMHFATDHSYSVSSYWYHRREPADESSDRFRRGPGEVIGDTITRTRGRDLTTSIHFTPYRV